MSVACAACASKGGDSPTSPTPPTTPTPPAGFVFDYDATVSSADREVIQNAMGVGRTYFNATFGETVHNTVTVHVRDTSGSVTAFGGVSELTLFTQTIDWQRASRLTKFKIMVHELFHVLQYDVVWIPTNLADPNWLVEGSAEFVGYAASANAGLTTYDIAKACQINKFFAFGGPSTVPRLENFSTSIGGAYPEAWLAVDRLLGGVAGLAKLTVFWRTGPPAQTAFSTAFGIGLGTFYAQFESYRQSLTTVTGVDCTGF